MVYLGENMTQAYQEMIMEDTGCSTSDAIMVEDIMRNKVFHSTLDWQTRTQFRQGARKAYQLLQEMRPEYEEYYRGVRVNCEDGKRQQAEYSHAEKHATDCTT